ncbi:MAG: hypothetical protein ACK52W_03735 [Alphaproteobacteria bacterium]
MVVDIARLIVYGTTVGMVIESLGSAFVISASLAACLGSLVGSIWLKGLKLRFIQWLVALLLYGLGVALIAGLI